MTKFLKDFFAGAGSTLSIYPDCDYIVPDKRGFTRDLLALRGDSAVVCNGIRQQVKQYRNSAKGGK